MKLKMLFDINNDEYEFRKTADIESEWSNVPDADVRQEIAKAVQYLSFHYYVMKNFRSVKPDKENAIYQPLGLTVRASALKAAILVAGSIAEAALRSHGEMRNLPFPTGRRKTFGVVLRTWKDDPSSKADIDSVIAELDWLKEERNEVHLHVAIDNGEHFFEKLEGEKGAIGKIRRVFKVLKGLTST